MKLPIFKSWEEQRDYLLSNAAEIPTAQIKEIIWQLEANNHFGTNDELIEELKNELSERNTRGNLSDNALFDAQRPIL